MSRSTSVAESLPFDWGSTRTRVFNASDRPTTQRVPGTARAGYRLHPVQASGSDPVVRAADYDRRTGEFTVPARTIAVFEH